MPKGSLCQLCHEVNNDTTGRYCQKCYMYLRNHPEGVYQLPPKGVVALADNGDPICHICGMAYRKLGNHIYNKHHISQVEYRKMFGLHHNTRLSNTQYQQTMHNYVDQYYDKVVAQNLIVKGVATRTSDSYKLPGRRIGNKQIKLVKGCGNGY